MDLTTKFKWSTQGLVSHINKGDEALLKMPTLYMKPFKSGKYKERKQTFYTITLQNDEKLEVKLGEGIFYGYPSEHSGRIEGILTRAEMRYLMDFDPENYHHYIRNNEDMYDLDVIKKNKNAFF